MTFTDAAAEVLRLVGRPLHYKEITEIAIERNLLSHVGKSPEVTMGARLAALLKKESEDNPLVRVKPGVFALRSWDEKTIKTGLEARSKGKKIKIDEAEVEVATGGDEVEPEADEAPVAHAGELEDEPLPPDEDALASAESADVAERRRVDDLEPPGPDDVMRAEAAAGAAEMFEEEEDDDQPILGGGADERPAADGGEGRRRRRRRRRGRGPDEAPVAGANGNGRTLPAYTATPVEGTAAPRREGFRGPQVIEVASPDGPPLDDAAGRELADAVAGLLGTLDRGEGAASLRQIAEAAQRRGRVSGDPQLLQSQIAATVRADNARRLAQGQRPRFRFAGGRISLTDWALGGELARLEQEALAAVERYREGARRAFARKLGELPGHAFVEIALLLVERLGVSQLRSLRRPGQGGGEVHLSGVTRDDVRVAVVVRRDGREIGRERVAELRGSLHHYGPATLGWMITAGQVLSGAREEATVAGAPPVSLFDGLAVARLAEENDVAVIRARLPIAIPDLDLLEALRAS
jgi:hypothetical protein